jgi:hypothetical protein
MTVQVLTVLISVIGSIFVAMVTVTASSYFQKRRQLDAQRREEKRQHYTFLLTAMSGFITGTDDEDKAAKDFSLATNTIALVAPQIIVSKLMELWDEMRSFMCNREKPGSEDGSIELIRQLVIAIRDDLEIKPKDDPKSFKFRPQKLEFKKSSKS